MRSRAALFAVFTSGLASCGPAAGPVGPGRPQPRIESYTEPSAVTALVPIGTTLFVGTTNGLDRWDAKSESRTHLGAADGVPGQTVKSLSLAAGQKVWFATDGGIGRFDLDGGKGSIVPPPPPSLAHALIGLRQLLADPKGGVWIAATTGIYHADLDGNWQDLNLRKDVVTVWAQPDGVLWLGMRDGVIQRNPGGVFTHYGDKHGLAIQTVSLLVEGPDGAPVALGEDDKGKPRIAVFVDGLWSTYRLSSEPTVVAAAHRQGALVLATRDELITLYAQESGPDADGLSHDGSPDLLYVTGKRKKPPYTVAKAAIAMPAELTALAAAPGQTYVGTRTLGTSVVTFQREAAPGQKWLRPHELVAGAKTMFVACRDKSDCYVATGGRTAWRWDGKQFAPLSIVAKPNVTFLAVTRSPQGEVNALYREPKERMLHVARLDKGVFTTLASLKIETPSGATALSFAKYSPDGLLWLGLEYLDEDNDPRPYGVAIVDLATNSVTYHREDANARSARRQRILPIPIDVVDVAFLDDEIWFASGSGAVRLKGEDLKVWTEADELKSEILHGVVATEGGVIFVASGSGVGEYDGKHWSYPPALSLTVTGVARGSDGRLWLGTDKGLVAFDGKGTDKIDAASGLLDDNVADVAVDHLGRIWSRSGEGISIVTVP